MKNWNELSIKDKNDIIKVAVQNGITTLPEIRERYNEFAEEGEEETIEKVLPEVVVKPSEEDKNSLAKMIRMLPDAKSREDMYYEIDPWNVDEPLRISQNESIDRLYNVYKLSEYPDVSSHRTISNYLEYPFSKWLDRPMYNPITNTMHLPNSEEAKYDAAGFIPELAHAYQFHGDKTGFLDFLRSAFHLPGDIKINGKSGYERPGHMEHTAHSIIEPAIYDYVQGYTDFFNPSSYASGGKIHIKEKNRGKFTALKKRTGHSASWFKAHGTPAQRKMATFALNSRHWKHGDGGNLFLDGGTQESDNTRVELDIVPNLPMDNSAESKFYRDLALLSAMTDEEKKAEEFYNKAHDTGTIAPTDIQARRGWMEVNPISEEAEWHAPTTVSAAPLTEGQRMWQSPAFQLALAPLFEAPFMLGKAANIANRSAEQLIYRNKLSGIEPIRGIGYPGDAYSVTEGVSPTVKGRLMKNVVGRNVRELESEGFRPNAIRNYTKNLSDALDEVRVGRFSNRDFTKAGMGDDAGFYIDGNNFMAINRDATAFTDEYIQGHEGRHLMDYRQSLTNNQQKILSDAYGDDFVNLPNTRQADGLEGYGSMAKEKVTTNHDARAALLGNKQDMFDIHAQDLVIDKTPDTKIFDAVERANGYGRRYIKYLRENNLLTPEKAQAFREAMKHVGGYVPWTIGGGSLGYGYLNQEEGPLVEMAMGGRLNKK